MKRLCVLFLIFNYLICLNIYGQKKLVTEKKTIIKNLSKVYINDTKNLEINDYEVKKTEQPILGTKLGKLFRYGGIQTKANKTKKIHFSIWNYANNLIYQHTLTEKMFPIVRSPVKLINRKEAYVYLKKTRKPFSGLIYDKNKQIITEINLENGIILDLKSRETKSGIVTHSCKFQKNAEQKEWYLNGRKKSEYKKVFLDEYDSTIYLENSVEWYSNGQIKSESKFYNGILQTNKICYENGQIKSEYDFFWKNHTGKLDDLKDESKDTLFILEKDIQKVTIFDWNNDFVVLEKEFGTTGKLIRFRKYLNAELIEADINYSKDTEFPGGISKLYDYLFKNIQYPEAAKEIGIQGTVFVQFFVSSDGTLENFKIAKGVHKTLDAEALRVVESMPKWIPGWSQGMRVSTRFTLPIKFRIS